MTISAETLCSSAEVAVVLGLTRRRVAQLAADGAFARDEDGKYPLAAAVQAYIDFKLSSAVASTDAAELAQERALLARAQRLKLEREAAVAAGKLLDRDQIVTAYQGLVANCRAKLLVIPSRAAPELVGLDEPAQAQALLTDLVHEALGELAEGR